MEDPSFNSEGKLTGFTSNVGAATFERGGENHQALSRVVKAICEVRLFATCWLYHDMWVQVHTSWKVKDVTDAVRQHVASRKRRANQDKSDEVSREDRRRGRKNRLRNERAASLARAKLNPHVAAQLPRFMVHFPTQKQPTKKQKEKKTEKKKGLSPREPIEMRNDLI